MLALTTEKLVLVVLVAAFLGALALLERFLSGRRPRRLAGWAAARGFEFGRYLDPDLPKELVGPQCFQLGVLPTATNILRGHWGDRPFVAFDFQCVPEEAYHRSMTFCAVTLESDVPLEPLLIHPEGKFDKFQNLLGLEDVDLKAAEFNTRFRVQADDSQWALAVLHPQTVQFLMDRPVPFTIELGGHFAVAFQPKPTQPADIQSAAEVLAGILDALPPHLVQQQERKLQDSPEATTEEAH